MKQALGLATHGIAANQVNYNLLYKDEVSDEFMSFCRHNAVQIVAYQPLKRQQVLENAIVQEIAKKYNASAAQVALAWLLSQDVLPIPKAVKKEHIDENVRAVELQLSDQDRERLGNL